MRTLDDNQFTSWEKIAVPDGCVANVIGVRTLESGQREFLVENSTFYFLALDGPAQDAQRIKRLDDLEAQRDNFERKGKELCQAYGTSLITIYDLQKQVAEAGRAVFKANIAFAAEREKRITAEEQVTTPREDVKP